MEKTVTAFKIQKRNPQRVNVYLDNEFAFGLYRVTAAWLEIGQVLTEERMRELQVADESEVTRGFGRRFEPWVGADRR